MMKSNDTLLCYLLTSDEKLSGEIPKLKVDEIVQNPTHIDVAVNEVVYIHFIHSNTSSFDIDVITPTSVTKINPSNSVENSCNTIIKSMGNVQFKSTSTTDFYVQFLRILY